MLDLFRISEAHGVHICLSWNINNNTRAKQTCYPLHHESSSIGHPNCIREVARRCSWKTLTTGQIVEIFQNYGHHCVQRVWLDCRESKTQHSKFGPNRPIPWTNPFGSFWQQNTFVTSGTKQALFYTNMMTLNTFVMPCCTLQWAWAEICFVPVIFF